MDLKLDILLITLTICSALGRWKPNIALYECEFNLFLILPIPCSPARYYVKHFN